MKIRLLFLSILLFYNSHAWSWGQTGHRIVGLIAERHLSKKAFKNLQMVLGNERLAMVSNYMDQIRSDKTYDFMFTWHWATIPDGQTYEQAGTPQSGDVIVTIQRLVQELKTKKFTNGDEAFTVKLLVHLIGDIHQPLHVGNGTDKGGNEVKLKYFLKSSNLHRVWDSGIIDNQQLSYTEYAESIDFATPQQLKDWQATSVLDWVYESMALREQVYNIPEDGNLSYHYDYDNLATVNLRLRQAGIRLAGILNEIYG